MCPHKLIGRVIPNMLRKSVLWSTLGNHDTGQDPTFKDTYPYFNIFNFNGYGRAFWLQYKINLGSNN